jgi:hypothetical protein
VEELKAAFKENDQMCEAEATLEVPQEQRLLCSAMTIIKANKVAKVVKKVKKTKGEKKGLIAKNYKLSKKEKREKKLLEQSKKI